jgi:Putative zinc-finger
MRRLSEETLNAYADGALEAAARAEVEAHLEVDPEARALLEKLRKANALAIEAFAAPMREPPPQALIDAVLTGPGNDVASDPGMRQKRRPPRAWRVRDYTLPLAAGLALAIGVTAGVYLGRQPAQAPGELALGIVPGDSTLHRLLEGHPSGSSLNIGQAQARRLGIVATFRDRHARPCREVEVLPTGTDAQALAAGVACRDAGGRWAVEGATRLAGAPQAPGGQFEPSGVPEKDALEGLLAMLGARRALSAAEEKELIERGWKN